MKTVARNVQRACWRGGGQVVRIGKIAGCGLLEICMGSSHEGVKKCYSHHRKLFEVQKEYDEDWKKHFAIKLCAVISEVRAFSHSFTPCFVIYRLKKTNKKTLSCSLILWKAPKFESFLQFLCALFFFFFILKRRSGDHPTQQETYIETKMSLHVIWVNKSKSLMAKHQLTCHGKFPVDRTAGCWSYIKKKKICFWTSHMSLTMGRDVLKTTTKIKLTQ